MADDSAAAARAVQLGATVLLGGGGCRAPYALPRPD